MANAQTLEKITEKNNQLLKSILEELNIMKMKVDSLFPQEDLEGYSHPERIKASYKKALKQYPPS